MAAIVIDGNAIAAAVRREWKGRADALKRRGVLPEEDGRRACTVRPCLLPKNYISNVIFLSHAPLRASHTVFKAVSD